MISSMPGATSSSEYPCISTGMPHATSTFSMPRRSSPFDSVRVLPFSMVTSEASSSICSSSSDLSLKRYCTRSTAGVDRQLGKAACAASTAAATSAADPTGARPSGSPVAGLVSSRPASLVGASHLPPMKLRTSVRVNVVIGISLYRSGRSVGSRNLAFPPLRYKIDLLLEEPFRMRANLRPTLLFLLLASSALVAQQPGSQVAPKPTTNADAPTRDTSYIDEKGTAHVTRVVPVPEDISSQAQLALGRAEPDQGPPESLEVRREKTDAYTARAKVAWTQLCPNTLEIGRASCRERVNIKKF